MRITDSGFLLVRRYSFCTCHQCADKLRTSGHLIEKPENDQAFLIADERGYDKSFQKLHAFRLIADFLTSPNVH